MVNVAVAGGTGGVGRAIVEALQGSKHHAFVLSRKPSSSDANTIVVDYNDIDSLVSTLETNNIHTVISTFGITDTSLAISQLNLIKAATGSKVTKRFVPSGFAIPYPEEAIELLHQLKDYVGAIKELRNSGLEWTIFQNGLFLDYFGPSSLKTYLRPNPFVIDIENKVAGIPGDGNTLVTLTYSLDLAKFVVASLDLEKWEEESRVVGDEISWNEFVALAEEARGAKFEVHYDDIEKLNRFEITELPAQRALYDTFPKKAFQWFTSIFERFTADGTTRIAREGSLNEKFPDIKPLTVRDMLDQYWKDVK
ncbi:hypothetical protein BJY04DRAFT_194103 [Aspergillus karnatakaensis]|uniref:uncharacterized protein n=1 Tax=Aspergillus karnatakaensis TaxID=1810916 RepID=UPI003CCE20FB